MGLVLSKLSGAKGYLNYGRGFDSDAVTFLTATGITNIVQQKAINELVIDLKGYGIWTKQKALYPVVGGTSARHAVNLRTPGTYNLSFTAGWIHSSTGMTPNGTSDYANTSLTPSSNTILGSFHHSIYSRVNSAVGIMGGCNSNETPQRYTYLSNSNTTTMINVINNTSLSTNSATITDTLGLMVGNRISSTIVNAFKNGVKVLNDTSNIVTERPTINYYIGGRNNVNVASNFDNKQIAFYSIGDGLTDTEAANFYTAVQKFQTTLGRQV